MTLEELLAFISGICLQHNSINQFGYGDNFEIGTHKGETYPYAFLETPYQITYDQLPNRKQYQFGLIICTGIANDNTPDSHSFISQAESIADAILFKLKKDLKATGNAFLVSANGASLKEFTDESANGIRYDLQIVTGREVCENNYLDQFSI